MRNFKIYKIKTSYLNIHYNVNPIMNILILNSFTSAISKNIRQTFNFVFKKDILLMLRLSLYFQSLYLHDRFKMVSYSGMHRHASYKNICYTLYGMDDCCIRSYVSLSSKYEKKLFFLDNKKFKYYHFFIDLLNYKKMIDNNFFILSNKVFNNILILQFIEYFSKPLERTLSSSVGSARASKKRNIYLGMEYFFLDFWDIGYIFFHKIEIIFKFLSISLKFLQFSIIDYLI